VQGELKTATPPDVTTFISAGQGVLGLADSLIDLGGGLLQELVTAKSTASMEVTEHVVSGWSGWIRLWEVSEPFHDHYAATDGTGDFSDTGLFAMAGQFIKVEGGPDGNSLGGALHAMVGTGCQVQSLALSQSTMLGEGGMCDNDAGIIPCPVVVTGDSLTRVSSTARVTSTDVNNFGVDPLVVIQAIPTASGLGVTYDQYSLTVYGAIDPCGNSKGYVNHRTITASGVTPPVLSPLTSSPGDVQYQPFQGAPLAHQGPYADYLSGHVTGEADADLMNTITTPVINHELKMRFHFEWDLYFRK
jgi:hypothetical protein